MGFDSKVKKGNRQLVRWDRLCFLACEAGVGVKPGAPAPGQLHLMLKARETPVDLSMSGAERQRRTIFTNFHGF